MRLSSTLAIVALFSSFAVSGQPRITGQHCVDALRIAAKSEYNISTDTSLDTAFSDAFCEAVKDKKESKQKTDGSVLYSAFYATFTNDQSQLSDYQRTYCRDTRSKLAFKSAYKFYASVVTRDALKDFNVCMDKVRQAEGGRGVVWNLKPTNACYSVVDISYVRPGEQGPVTANVKSVEAFNVQCATVPKVLTASPQPVACRRTSWGDASLAIGTTQQYVPVEFPTVSPPAAPVAPQFAQVDQKVKVFTVTRGQYPAGTTCTDDGRVCRGPMSLGAGAANVSVVYGCDGGVNENGHGYCGWSYGNRGGADWNAQYGANWQTVSDGELQWIRNWTGDAQNRIVETYTVKYTLPHVVTPEEMAQSAAHAEATKQYKASLDEGPCPKPAEAAKSPAKPRKSSKKPT
jgi:hypothetical protein